jgi:hypothetical protein
MDCGLLLLEGLAQILVREAELDQVPVEPRDLILSLLEGRLRPLERDALLLELTQRLLPRQAPPLKRSPGLDESGLLLLKLAFRLLACDSLLPELLLRHGERGSLVRQGRLQPLGLLEGRAALLELGAGGDDLGLPRCRDGARPIQVLASPAQRVVSLHQHRPYPLDPEAPPAAWAPCSGGRSSRASALYASHQSGDLRASTRASRASYYPRYQ